MTTDTDPLTDQQIIAATALGESESLGISGMTGTILTISNRASLNHSWMGGNTMRGVCLQKGQYDVWWPQFINVDRARVLRIVNNYPSQPYPLYETALELAQQALDGKLTDYTSHAVSYYDSDKCVEPDWSESETPCYVEGERLYFDYKSVIRWPKS